MELLEIIKCDGGRKPREQQKSGKRISRIYISPHDIAPSVPDTLWLATCRLHSGASAHYVLRHGMGDMLSQFATAPLHHVGVLVREHEALMTSSEFANETY